MRKSIFVAAALAVVAAGWILSGQLPGDARTEGNDETVAVPAAGPPARAPMRVQVATLQAKPRRSDVVVSGRTEPSRTVELRAETYGRVVEIYARRGQSVKKGDVLGRLAVEDRSAKLAEAAALLRQREVEFNAASELRGKGFRSETSLAAAQAQLDAARAVVEQMQIDMANTKLRAPFDGVLDAGHVELGDFVQIGDAAGTIVDLDPILAVGHVSEREVGLLEEGTMGTATLIDGQTIEGIISFISSVADPVTRTYRVELEVPNADNRIRAGLTAEIAIGVRQEMAHLVSPSILTLADDGVIGVQTVSAEDRVVFMPVRLLADSIEGVWLGGLPPIVRIITVGQDFVVPGQLVEPIETNAAAADGGGV